jgi:hypothetical protein
MIQKRTGCALIIFSSLSKKAQSENSQSKLIAANCSSPININQPCVLITAEIMEILVDMSQRV